DGILCFGKMERDRQHLVSEVSNLYRVDVCGLGAVASLAEKTHAYAREMDLNTTHERGKRTLVSLLYSNCLQYIS
ncbi:unnamed protein product, partial [Didymodactylos carnosus]